MALAISGCAGNRRPPSRAKLKQEARQVVKEAPSAIVRVVGGRFQVENSAGQVVLVARIHDASALVQPSDPSRGPLTLAQAYWTLYKEGKPSLWLQAPVSTWQGGLLTAPRGARSGSVDGKIALQGKTAKWAASTNLLSMATVQCELRDPGQPEIRAQGPAATWQNGLLVMPAGAAARAADRSASMRADHLRWRPRTHSLQAAGRVRMTRDRLAGAGQRLTGDTALQHFRLTGGRPRITIYNQPAPLVAAAGAAPGETIMSHPAAPRLAALAGGFVLLTASPGSGARAAPRSRVTLSSGITVEARDLTGDPTAVHAAGDVVLTSTQGMLRADRVDVALAGRNPASGAARSAVREAVASGHVRLTSEQKPGERMEATGTRSTYWPADQKATLTGGVTVTMTSPQLQEPAVMTGARADMDLAKRSATVVRAAAQPVTLTLRPKAQPASGAGSTATTGPLQLQADQVLIENAVNRVTATGSPVLTGDQGTVHADRIWFDIDPQARDVKTVHAVGAVRIDSQDAERGTFRATAHEAVMNRDENTVLLTGDVHGSQLQPGDPEPRQFQGEALTYNLKTGAYDLHASAEARAQVRFTPKPKAGATEK